MKKILFFLLIFLPLCKTTAQTAEEKKYTCLKVKQAIADFQANFGSVTSRPKDEQDETEFNKAEEAFKNRISSNCRVHNDLIKVSNSGSEVIDFLEYYKYASLIFPAGFNYELDVKDIEFVPEFKKHTNGFLVEAYITKTIFGQTHDNKELYVKSEPCRIGVFVDGLGSNIKLCKIEFIDHDLSKRSKTINLESFSKTESMTLEESMKQMAKTLSQQINSNHLRTIQLTTLTYDEAGVIDDFSIRVTTILRNELTRLNPDVQITAPSRSFGENIIIEGGYLVKGNQVEFITKISDLQKNVIGIAETKVAKSNLSATDKVEPNSQPKLVEEAKQINQILNNSITNNAQKSKETLKFEITTNRGDKSVTFAEGEKMKVKLKANQPCNVRLVYRLADNQLALLRNQDFQISEYNSNQEITLPDDFTCAEPFGVEFLIAYASIEPFNSLTTHQEGDYVMIDNSLSDVKKISTAPKRGMKNDSITSNGVVEKVVQITTRKQ